MMGPRGADALGVEVGMNHLSSGLLDEVAHAAVAPGKVKDQAAAPGLAEEVAEIPALAPVDALLCARVVAPVFVGAERR